MVIAQVSVTPIGTNTPSASEYVARAVRPLKKQKGIRYLVNAMGTSLEGELPQVIEAARTMHESVFGDDVKRVVTTIIIDDRRDKNLTLEYKVQSVMKKVG